MPKGAQDEKGALLQALQYQRASVLAIVEGLNEGDWHRSVVPSGWTVAGLVAHLGDAERHWFQEVVAGKGIDLPWDEGRPAYDPKAAFTTDRSSTDVLIYYRELCRRSDQVLAGTSMSDAPVGRHRGAEVSDVRTVVLHMIEETVRHAGHLDLARKLLDGKVRLGGR